MSASDLWRTARLLAIHDSPAGIQTNLDDRGSMKQIIWKCALLASAGLILPACSNRSSHDALVTHAAPVDGAQFAYLVATSKVESESALDLPRGSKTRYRILTVQQQGNCEGGCPASTIYVAVWDTNDWSPEHMKLFKIDKVRFYSALRVTSYDPTVSSGTFLTFRVNSRPFPQEVEHFEVSVSRDDCLIKPITQ